MSADASEEQEPLHLDGIVDLRGVTRLRRWRVYGCVLIFALAASSLAIRIMLLVSDPAELVALDPQPMMRPSAPPQPPAPAHPPHELVRDVQGWPSFSPTQSGGDSKVPVEPNDALGRQQLARQL